MIIATTDAIHDLEDLKGAVANLLDVAGPPIDTINAYRPFKVRLHLDKLSDGSEVMNLSVVFIGEDY